MFITEKRFRNEIGELSSMLDKLYEYRSIDGYFYLSDLEKKPITTRHERELELINKKIDLLLKHLKLEYKETQQEKVKCELKRKVK